MEIPETTMEIMEFVVHNERGALGMLELIFESSSTQESPFPGQVVRGRLAFAPHDYNQRGNELRFEGKIVGEEG